MYSFWEVTVEKNKLIRKRERKREMNLSAASCRRRFCLHRVWKEKQKKKNNRRKLRFKKKNEDTQAEAYTYRIAIKWKIYFITTYIISVLSLPLVLKLVSLSFGLIRL